MSTRLVAGCMTGTSLDGLDMALVAVEGGKLSLRATVMRTHSLPFGELGERLRNAANQEPMSAKEFANLALQLGHLHVQGLKEMVGEEELDLIAVHGQTLFHAPPISLQLFNAAPVAAEFSVPIVFDFRSMDLANGGQGAPITPLADFILFNNPAETRCIINLGGFCNVTRIPACARKSSRETTMGLVQVAGGDLCVCNQLLDRLAQTLFNVPYDENGELAAKGKEQYDPFEDLHEKLEKQAGGGRSLGTGDEMIGWLDRYKDNYKPEDLLRTACEGIAATIARRTDYADRLLVAGGGMRNISLTKAIKERSDSPVESTNEYGVPSQYREAVCMALLGIMCRDRVPITLPQVTGVQYPPVSGTWILP